MRLSIFTASFALASSATAAPVAFMTPDVGTYGWDREVTANSTYAEWDVFTSTSGTTVDPSSPDVDSFIGGTLPGTAADFGIFDADAPASGSFYTGSGNIYSPSAAVSPQIDFGGFGLGTGYNTTILLQIRTIGTEALPSSFFLNGSIAPISTTELSRVGGGFGDNVETLIRFDVSGNLDSYSLNFTAFGPHMSLDAVAIDTYTFVPTPATTAILGMSALAIRRRRR